MRSDDGIISPANATIELKNRNVNLPTTFGCCAHQSRITPTPIKQRPAVSCEISIIVKPESVNATALTEMITELENLLNVDRQTP